MTFVWVVCVLSHDSHDLESVWATEEAAEARCLAFHRLNTQPTQYGISMQKCEVDGFAVPEE